MKFKLFIIPTLLLSILIAPSCEAKEDGDINEWTGEYEFGANYIIHMHRYITGEKKQIGDIEYLRKESDHFFIYSDKTWQIRDYKGLGPTGQVRCYKDHINLTDMLMDYQIDSKYDFKIVYKSTESVRKYVEYYIDESDGRSRGDYDYSIRFVSFFYLNKI